MHDAVLYCSVFIYIRPFTSAVHFVVSIVHL